MDPGKFVIGQVQRNINWNDFNEDCQTNVLKLEPCETDHFNERDGHSEEKFDTENLIPEDLNHSKYSEDREIDCNYLSQASQSDAVKNEPCEINIFTECGSYCNSYNNATPSCQELAEEKLDIKNLKPDDLDHSVCSKNLFSSKGNTAQIKNEEHKDIFQEDIKCETDEEKSSKHFTFCEVCYQSIDRETDDRFKCSCQKQNESLFYDISGQDLTHDVKPVSPMLTTDSGLQKVGVQDNTISGNEVTIKQESSPSAESQRISMSPRTNGIEMKCKSYLRKGVFAEHQFINKADEKIQCKFCSKFLSKRHIKYHERSHTGEELFHCQICSTSFTRKEHFVRHERMHAGGKPFSCKICSKSFTRMDTLKVHERSHTGEKPFSCKICSKSFNRIGNLTVHERTHTGEKPFQCKICSKSYRYMISLKTHVSSHTGKKPFHCKTCSKSFGHMVSLKTHEKIHTNKKSSHCKKIS